MDQVTNVTQIAVENNKRSGIRYHLIQGAVTYIRI